MSLPTSAFSNPNMNMQDAFIYNDVQGLQNIKHQAGTDEEGALRAVSQQFESMFMQMIMKSMRDATNSLNEDSFLDTQYTEKFQEMHDEQLVQNLSQRGGLGLGEMLYQQLSRNSDRPSGNNVPDLLPLNSTGRPILPSAYRHQVRPETAEPSHSTQQQFDSPEAFVQAMWPHAEQAAEAMNADPRYLIAQAALETGWGQHVIGRQDGSSTHNVFNIKADQRWGGESARVDTREYLQGRPVTVEADFRAYDSIAQSFADYQRFLTDNPRYEQALQAAPDGPAYARALQDAGYATDPAYADKIDRIANSPYLMQGLASVQE